MLPVRLTLISDTHGLHRRIPALPGGDVLIHAGDLTSRGEEHTVRDFIAWLAKQDYRYKIFIAGNHDFFFEEDPAAKPQELARSAATTQKLLPPGVHYLCDTGTTLDGVTFWGTPVTPRFFDWAFNRDRGAQIAKHYKLIPPHTDVLITHGPPHGMLDRTTRGIPAGCEELANVIKSRKNGPGSGAFRLHVFGHIHEQGGQQVEQDGTTYINAAVLDEHYRIAYSAQTFELEAGRRTASQSDAP